MKSILGDTRPTALPPLCLLAHLSPPHVAMNKGMSNVKLTKICTTHYHTKYLFKGVFACNKLHGLHISDDPPFFIICNTENDMSNTIGHWVSIYRNEDFTSYFFNSLGAPPQDEILQFIIKLGGTYTHNVHRYQDYNSDCCGEITLMYCDLRSQGFTDDETLSTFSLTHLKLNDSISRAYVYGHMTA